MLTFATRPLGWFFLIAALGTSPAWADTTSYPLTMQNCGQEISFEKAPRQTVTVGQAATEVLYSLGLADRVAGTSVWFNEVLPDFKQANESIERLADNDPSFESVVAKRPDLVAAQFEWHVGPEGSVATREQFHELGIPTYLLPADCMDKDNTQGSDGTRQKPFTMDLIYRGVRELAKIFDVQDAGAVLISDLKAREEKARQRVAALNADDISAAFWFSSANIRIDPYMAGRKGAPGYMMEQLGIRNVIESDEEWPVVGWETIAKANPTILVIARMDRRRYPADDHEKKLAFLRSDPVTSQMDAVRNNRIILMDAHAMDATIRSVSGIETLADSLESFGLAQ